MRNFGVLRGLGIAGVLAGSSVLSGCDMSMSVKGMKLGAYEAPDMRDSVYRDVIVRKAGDVEGVAKSPIDFKTAAELYGSVGEMDGMDRCIEEFFDRSPREGLWLMKMGDGYHSRFEDSKN